MYGCGMRLEAHLRQGDKNSPGSNPIAIKPRNHTRMDLNLIISLKDRAMCS